MSAPTYNRTMAVALAPMTAGCTKCLATRGGYCRSRGGYANAAVEFHAARVAAVAHLSEQQRFDAYAEMRAEEAALRAQVSARLARPLSPAQATVRAGTRTAWDATNRKPLSPIRGVVSGNVVDLNAARARRAAKSVPAGGESA